jgi:Transposase and inactivated derivatives
MSQSLSKVYIHLTFSTKHRYPHIDSSIKDELWKYIGGICKKMECNPIQIGGHNDHIHICCVLSKKINMAYLIFNVKKQSSIWIKTKGKKYANFYWQVGYGVFSVNPSEIEIVSNYIKSQEEHHKTRSFQEELVAFLKKYGVEYDERYIWY